MNTYYIPLLFLHRHRDVGTKTGKCSIHGELGSPENSPDPERFYHCSGGTFHPIDKA